MKPKYTPLGAAINKVKDDVDAALSSAPERERKHLLIAREQLCNASTQLEMCAVLTNETNETNK